MHYNSARNIFRIYAYLLFLYCENDRCTNLYCKINILIDKELRKKIMIDFSIKESICIDKTHSEYNKEIIYFDKIYQANYQGDSEYNYRY